MEQVKSRPSFKRTEYNEIIKNPVRIASFATDPKNVGGILRSAEAFFIEEVFCLVKPDTATSCGSDKWMRYTVFSSEGELIEHIKRIGKDFSPILLEITNESRYIFNVGLPRHMLLVVGNETLGIPKEVLDLKYPSVSIPQFGFMASLNVASATTVALYEWVRQFG